MPNTDTAKENARERVNHDFYKAFKMYHGRVDVYEVLALRYAEKLEKTAGLAQRSSTICRQRGQNQAADFFDRIAALAQEEK